MASAMGQAMRLAGDDRTVANYVSAVYWSRGHKTPDSCESSRVKAEKLRETMTDEQRVLADKLVVMIRRRR